MMQLNDEEVLCSVKALGDEEINIDVLPEYNPEGKYGAINQQLSDLKLEINSLDKRIDNLTSHTDKIDIAVSVGVGVIAGALDIVFGSSKSLKSLEASPDKLASICGKGNIENLGNHSSVGGLVSSVSSQFSRKSYSVTNGILKTGELDGGVLLGRNPFTKVIFGVFNWCYTITKALATGGIVAGSTGVPGPIMSILSDASRLPIFKDKNGYSEFSRAVGDAFYSNPDYALDINAEAQMLTRQALIVMLNELIVRGFYFFRRLITEMKENKVKKPRDLKKLDWRKILPFKNRTVNRMLTVSMSVMTAIDLADAAIESLIKNGANQFTFVTGFVLRVNFPGVLRTGVQITNEMISEYKLTKSRNERMLCMQEYIKLNSIKAANKEYDMWNAAISCGEAIENTYKFLEEHNKDAIEEINKHEEALFELGQTFDKAVRKNPSLKKDIKEIFDWE